MARAASPDSADDVLESIRRIVAEENGQGTEVPFQSSQSPAADRPPVFSGSTSGNGPISAARKTQNRRSEALRQARALFGDEEAVQMPAPRAKPEPLYETDRGNLCKLLLTEDFQVRGPEEDQMSFLPAPEASADYMEDSDVSEMDARPTLESVVRTAVADSVRAALNTGIAMDDEPDLLDDDGYIDAETLRALVMSIVHEELRGELGRQISMRVRKLVRHEINRALEVQNLIP